MSLSEKLEDYLNDINIVPQEYCHSWLELLADSQKKMVQLDSSRQSHIDLFKSDFSQFFNDESGNAFSCYIKVKRLEELNLSLSIRDLRTFFESKRKIVSDSIIKVDINGFWFDYCDFFIKKHKGVKTNPTVIIPPIDDDQMKEILNICRSRLCNLVVYDYRSEMIISKGIKDAVVGMDIVDIKEELRNGFYKENVIHEVKVDSETITHLFKEGDDYLSQLIACFFGNKGNAVNLDSYIDRMSLIGKPVHDWKKKIRHINDEVFFITDFSQLNDIFECYENIQNSIITKEAFRKQSSEWDLDTVSDFFKRYLASSNLSDFVRRKVSEEEFSRAFELFSTDEKKINFTKMYNAFDEEFVSKYISILIFDETDLNRVLKSNPYSYSNSKIKQYLKEQLSKHEDFILKNNYGITSSFEIVSSFKKAGLIENIKNENINSIELLLLFKDQIDHARANEIFENNKKCLKMSTLLLTEYIIVNRFKENFSKTKEFHINYKSLIHLVDVGNYDSLAYKMMHNRKYQELSDLMLNHNVRDRYVYHIFNDLISEYQTSRRSEKDDDKLVIEKLFETHGHRLSGKLFDYWKKMIA